MMKFNLLKGLDIASLEDQGMKKEEIDKLMVVVMPILQKEFEEKVMIVVGRKRMKEIQKQAIEDKLTVGQELEIVEKIYYKKTGKYFMEEMRLMINEMLHKLSTVMKIAKGQMEKYEELNKADKGEFEKLIKDKKWEEVLKLVNKDLGRKEEEHG